jgi:hypothetical protein
MGNGTFPTFNSWLMDVLVSELPERKRFALDSQAVRVELHLFEQTRIILAYWKDATGAAFEVAPG